MGLLARPDPAGGRSHGLRLPSISPATGRPTGPRCRKRRGRGRGSGEEPSPLNKARAAARPAGLMWLSIDRPTSRPSPIHVLRRSPATPQEPRGRRGRHDRGAR